MKFSLGQIAEIVKGTLEGDPSVVISEMAEIQNAGPGEITFLGNPRYAKYLSVTGAEAILVPRDFTGSYKNLIRVDNPNYAYALILARLRPGPPSPQPGIRPSAVIAESASLGRDVYIGPNVVIDEKVSIGDGVVLHANSYIGYDSHIGSGSVIFPNVTVYHGVRIGKNVRIHAGAVIGSDGFGFVRTEAGISKIPQAGGVLIEDDVEIGANCAIDRGTLGDTVIRKGTKIDNLVQIAHNVKIGQYCFLAGQSGIAGSATLEDFVTVAGQVGIAGHLTIGKGVIIAAQSGVSKDIAAGSTVLGSPAQDMSKASRELAHIRSIPDIKQRLKELEKRTRESYQATHGIKKAKND